jgi:hypothetical protein
MDNISDEHKERLKKSHFDGNNPFFRGLCNY